MPPVTRGRGSATWHAARRRPRPRHGLCVHVAPRRVTRGSQVHHAAVGGVPGLHARVHLRGKRKAALDTVPDRGGSRAQVTAKRNYPRTDKSGLLIAIESAVEGAREQVSSAPSPARSAPRSPPCPPPPCAPGPAAPAWARLCGTGRGARSGKKASTEQGRGPRSQDNTLMCRAASGQGAALQGSAGSRH